MSHKHHCCDPCCDPCCSYGGMPPVYGAPGGGYGYGGYGGYGGIWIIVIIAIFFLLFNDRRRVDII